jgi:peptidyl-prolyl cis-trans isomerase B (cyclophilin B)
MAFGARAWTFAVCLGAFLMGCGGQAPAPQQSEPTKPPPAALPGPAAAGAPAAQPAQQAAGTPKPGNSFQEAIVADPPEDQGLLEKTRTGKSIGKLYERVAGPDGEWHKVQFVSPQGKKLAYSATVTTDEGTIKIDLWPDVAPNHVRNFVALARAGYYDGLEFDRTVREEFTEQKGTFFECLEAGCPACTGDPRYGSIGYWLKPELSDTVHHEEGTVGAWHAEELETAACKFYITLSKAPWMDGNWTVFGKVSQGLDVARKILMRPVRDDDFKDRPVAPVVIRSVTIEAREAN